jgi:predicted Zn-dependent protease
MAIFAALSVIAACTSVSKYEGSKQALSKSEQEKLDEFRAELEIGRNMAGRLLAAYGTQPDSQLTEYVNQVGMYVAGFSDHPERKYMFEIIEGDFVNAFACPGGYILLTLGTIKHAENEAELAGVLAHEIAHVGLKHMFDKLKNMSAKELEEANKITTAKKLPENVAMRKRPTGKSSELGTMLAKYLSGGSAGLNIVKAAGAGMAVILETGLEPEKEYEADEHGVRFAVDAGYDPNGLDQFLCRLKSKDAKAGDCAIKNKKEKKKEALALDKTHPPIAERVARIERILDDMEADAIIGAKGKKRYARWRSKILSAN